ncbi:Wadjet anti-phage system protein JetD domain-containing protein [Arthrobacter monumenti]
MSPSHVTPYDARAQARKKYDRYAGRWAAAAAISAHRASITGHLGMGLPVLAPSPGSEPQADRSTEGAPTFVLPLHPPTERQVLADQQMAIAWVQTWESEPEEYVVWGGRRWASLGSQQVPERLILPAPADVARFADRSRHWAKLATRFARLASECAADVIGFADALPRNDREIAAMDEADFNRLLGVLGWLAERPDSGLYIRQLPIRGVHSKWVSAHRGLVERLHRAATGHHGLGLATKPELVRARFLDPDLAPGGLTDISVPLEQLAAMNIEPTTVFVFENLESVLAMPPMDGAVVIHGSGYAVDRLARVPWAADRRIIYWGDLDSHGFAILNRLRAHGLDVTTVLMNLETLYAYRDLCVVESRPATGDLQHLLPAERDVVAELAKHGHLRLEQERLDWPHCLDVLTSSSHRPYPLHQR